MNLLKATNLIKACLNGADYLMRYQYRNKCFVEFDYMNEDFAVQIQLMPVDMFRKHNAVGIHALAESDYEFINKLGNAIEKADKDNFPVIFIYCLPAGYIGRTKAKRDLAS